MQLAGSEKLHSRLLTHAISAGSWRVLAPFMKTVRKGENGGKTVNKTVSSSVRLPFSTVHRSWHFNGAPLAPFYR